MSISNNRVLRKHELKWAATSIQEVENHIDHKGQKWLAESQKFNKCDAQKTTKELRTIRHYYTNVGRELFS